MITNFIIADSGTHKVINYLKATKRGTILTIDDFMNIKDLSYTHIRSILVDLCQKEILIRICRGVYCYPIIENRNPIPPTINAVLSKIAEKDNYELCPTGEYAEYLLGIRETIPNKIICYNNEKVKTFSLEDGTSIKILPSKKSFPPSIKNPNLRMLVNYINNIGIDNISDANKVKLRNYYHNIIQVNKTETEGIPSNIVSFLSN